MNLPEIQEMFQRMRSDAGWDVDAELLWGYFFTGESKRALKAVQDGLAAQGYRFVELRRDEEGPFFWLHVERVETHSPQTLHARSQAFHQLADKAGNWWKA